MVSRFSKSRAVFFWGKAFKASSKSGHLVFFSVNYTVQSVSKDDILEKGMLYSWLKIGIQHANTVSRIAVQ